MTFVGIAIWQVTQEGLDMTILGSLPKTYYSTKTKRVGGIDFVYPLRHVWYNLDCNCGVAICRFHVIIIDRLHVL